MVISVYNTMINHYMKINLKKYAAGVLLFSALFVVNSAWAEVRAFLNQDTFFEGDPITLTIETNQNSQAQPDLGVLNQSFEVLGKSTSTQINILNGRKRIKKSWTIELQPHKKGTIQIPSIMVGQEKTKPLSLKITDIPPELEKQTSQHVFIESTVDLKNQQPYVQQQIPYTVRLYYDSAMQTGKIYSPTVKDAVVEQLGEDRRYRTVRKGKKYSVIEKHFVISPEKSGTLHIPPTSVKGRLTIARKGNEDQLQRRDNTDFMNRFFNNPPFSNDPFFRDLGGGFFSNRGAASKPFSANSESIDVKVQPIPKEFNGKFWLPAEELVIEDSWARNPPEFRVGEPVTRTLVLQAKGLAGSQIPDIELAKPANVRLYPEKGKSETRTDGKTVYGIKEMNISYLPDTEGKIVIPEISVDWWDVKTKTQKKFTLPEWTLNVAPAIDGASKKTVAVDKPETGNQSSLTSESVKNGNPESDNKAIRISPFWWAVVTAITLIALLLYYFFNRKKTHSAQSKVAHIAVDEIRKALQHACEKNDKQQAEKWLLALAEASWHDAAPPHNLTALAAKVQQGSAEILALERALYADEDNKWNGQALWNSVKNGLKTKPVKTAKTGNVLKPLYPA